MAASPGFRPVERDAVKNIVAFIKPFKLDEVKSSLAAMGIVGMSVSEVRGCGRQRGHSEIYRGAEYQLDFMPKIRIELAVGDGLLDEAVEAILQSAATGEVGDGKIFVSDLVEAIRIRTGETGENAL
jgi:nitrogen regulatory protein PII